MPQTVQILRTASNNPPGPLLPGELSTELGGDIKLWIGAAGGNRLLISTDPADTNAAAGSNYLPLTGGVLSGTLEAANSVTVNGDGTVRARVTVTTTSNAADGATLAVWNPSHANGFGLSWSPTTGQMRLGAIGTLNGTAGQPWMLFSTMTGITAAVPFAMQAGQSASAATAPTQPAHLTNKAYVDAGDAALAALLPDYLPLIGGDMLGAINLPLAPTADANATNKAYVDLQDAILQEQIDLLTDNLVFAGQIDASTDNGTYTAASGIPDGPLPAPVASLKGFYVIVNTGGQPPLGNIPPGTYARGDWIICDGTVWVELHLGLTSVIAPEVALSPSIPNLGANVQTALTYLQVNYLARSGGTAFAMTGGLSFGSTMAPGGPTDLSRHIALYGTNFGFGVTAGRINYVGGVHVFLDGGVEVLTVTTTIAAHVPLIAYSTLTLSADPLANLDAATKQYVDAAVAGGITAVVPDGVSIVGDGTPESPLECFRLDAGTY